VGPTRIVDTRTGNGGVNAGPLQPGTAYTLDLTQTPAPLNQGAYAFNVTAVHPIAVGNLRIGPACGIGSPLTSLINFQVGKDVANVVVLTNIVNNAPCNKFTIYSDHSPVDVVVDLQGYFANTDGFGAVTPTRLADTRSGLGGQSGPIAAGTVGSFAVAGQGGVPANAKAVALNVTAIVPSGAGNLRVFPDHGTVPTTSNINYITGVDKAAFVIVPLPPDGKIDVYADGSPINVAIDIFGYLPGSSTVVTQAPLRVLDTRIGAAPPLLQGQPMVVKIGGQNGVPADAKAVLVSLTAAHVPGSSGVGNLRAYSGSVGEPTTSNMNYVGAGTDVANMAIVPLASDGTITLATEGSPISIVIDVLGYVPRV
jgi:hypothetical protein